MLDTAWDLEIRMIIPFHSLIFYPDDYKDEYVEEPTFEKLRKILNIDMNVSEIIEEIRSNRGNINSAISIYYSEKTYKNFIIIDSEMDPTDQLDLITICIRCIATLGGVVRNYAHQFYTNCCEYNIIYSEGNYVVRNLYKIDFSLYSETSEQEYKNNILKKNIKFIKSGKFIKTIHSLK